MNISLDQVLSAKTDEKKTEPVQWADRSRRTAPATRQNNTPVRLPEGSLLPSDPEVRQVLTETANKYKLNPALLMAMAQQESNYNPTAVGPKTKWGTAKGMFQFLDSTARANGIDPTDFRQAAEVAARDLAKQTATKGVDWAVAHHHAGPNPKQHGSKTARYTQEVLTKAAAIARELGIEFQLPKSAKPDFSNVNSGGQRFSLDQVLSAQPQETSKQESTETESLGRTIQRNVLEGALKGPEFTRTDPVLANVAGAITRTVERGWEGIKNFLDRETETVERTDDELRRMWDTEVRDSPSVRRYGISFDQWAKDNRTVRVSTKPFAEEEAEWAQRLKDSPEDAHLLPKRLNHLRPKADDSRFKPADTFEGFAQRFISNHKNPLDLFLQDSIPANIVTHLFTLPETERKKFDQARRVTNALEATSNPEGKSEEDLELARQVIADWKKKTDSTIVDSWQELWQAAKEDPAVVGVGLSEAIIADPYMIAAPAGTGFIKPIRTVQAAQGIRASTLAGRAAKVADRFIDAASLTAAINVAAGAAENLATEGVVSDSEVKMNAAMGALIGGPIGAVFMRGARARAKGVDKAKLDGTLEETLRDMAKADVETEARVTDIYRRYPEGHGVGAAQTPLQQQLSELLGIKTYKDAEAWKTQRRKEVKEWFKDNPEYADYQRYVAEERLARSAQLADAAEAKRRSAADAAHGRSIEDAAVQRERWQQEFDAAIEARNAEEASQEFGSALRAAEFEDAARTLAQKLDAEELFYAQLSEDAPTIRQAEAKIKRREANLRIPKWQRGSTGILDDRITVYHATTKLLSDKIHKEGLKGYSPKAIIESVAKDNGVAVTDDLLDFLDSEYWLGEARSDSIRGPFVTTSKNRLLEITGQDGGTASLAEGPAATAYAMASYFDSIGNVDAAAKLRAYETALRESAPSVMVFKIPKDRIRDLSGELPKDIRNFEGDLIVTGDGLVLPENGGKPLGRIDPELMARLGVIAGGAAAGYALFPEDEKLAGGLLGGLAGLVVPAGGSVLSRMRQAGAISSDGQIISALVKAGKMANKLEEPEIRARDQAWIAAARAGDQEAFKSLWEAYHGKVTRFANKFVRGRESAIGATGEDIAQDAFLQVFRKLTDDPDFEIDNFPAYMMLAAEGRAINALSAAKTLKRGVDTVNESQYFKEDMYEGDRGSARSILDETTGEIEGNVILDNLKDTPELIAIRDEAMDIIRQAVDELPEQPRQLFTLVNLDHFTPEEAAKQLGMNRDAAYKALQRAETVVRRSVEENRRKLGEPADPSQYRGPRGQRGSASPDDLRNIAAVAATATAAGTAGYFMTDGNLWKTALLTGLVTPVGAALVKGKLRGSGNVIKGELGGANPVAVAIRSIDWRLKEMGEAIYGLAKKHGKQELEYIKAYNDATAPFIRMFSELPKDIKPVIVKALSTRDKVIIDKMLRQVGGEEFVKAFDQVRKKLDEVEDQLVGYGLIKKSEKDYFPFRVKDLDGLKAHLGKEAASEIDSALAKAEAKMQKLQQRPLTEIEKSVVINKVLEPYLGKPISAHTPGFAKARTIQVIDEALQQFYHDPIATLNSYGVQAIKYIERAKFFGRHLKKTKNAEGNYAVNIGDSIGEMVADLKNKGQLTDEQGVQLAGMLQDRFNGGEMASSHLVQGTKNLTNAALLGHIASAIVQLGDIAIQASRQGLVPSVRALRRQLTRDKLLDLKNFGLTEHVAHEFLSDGWTRKVADWSFKWGGFRAIDHIGKNFGLNAAVEKMFREAQTPEGILRLSDRFQRVFPDDFDKALGALKKGQVNEAVELMAFAELTRTQPITSWELPQFYHRMPNGRMIYHLQTFSLRVLNMVHEDALKDIASMKPARMARGTKALLGIGAILGVQGVASDKIKDFVAGKPIELGWEEVPLNALEALGMNMYDYNRIADKGPIAGIAEGKLPPILRMSQQVWEDPERSVRFVPVAGRAVYDRGKDYFEARRRERRKKEGYKMEIRVPAKEESGDRNRNRSRDRTRRRDR